MPMTNAIMGVARIRYVNADRSHQGLIWLSLNTNRTKNRTSFIADALGGINHFGWRVRKAMHEMSNNFVLTPDQRSQWIDCAESLERGAREALRHCQNEHESHDCMACPKHVSCLWAYMESPLSMMFDLRHRLTK